MIYLGVIGVVILALQVGYIVGTFEARYEKEFDKLTVREGMLLAILTMIWPISLPMGWIKLCEEILRSKKEGNSKCR